MTKTEVKNALDNSKQVLMYELEASLENSSFTDEQKEDLRFMFKQVWYTFNEFSNVIENLDK
ncbi:hypothetical protein [Paenibacillus gallinarum]|uniref:Uncharacterized protein n=1 Tax=Paenibacillus gallinarum TaxID=2762232 RepID=A0ABR8SW53_9BACL|nr:hypothetical protein [Paenibacillus gallinarum]MBD7967715.1 hypothetical protein [Paenibacillus gallinarum]